MRNRFVSTYWTLENLEAMLQAVEQARITGAVVSVKTGTSQETQFDPKSIDLNRLHTEILYALFLKEPLVYDNPHTQKVMSASTIYPGTYIDYGV